MTYLELTTSDPFSLCLPYIASLHFFEPRSETVRKDRDKVVDIFGDDTMTIVDVSPKRLANLEHHRPSNAAGRV